MEENCLASTIYHLNSDGQLSAANGEIYSTTEGVVSEPFIPSAVVGNISTTWQLSGGVLSFNNDAFLNGSASLCMDPISENIEIYFLAVPPSSCIPIFLTTEPCK